MVPAEPLTCPGLQAADYFLWALQRLYERREERYVTLLWPAVTGAKGVTQNPQRWGCNPGDYGTSHCFNGQLRGVAASFVDGSGRWLSPERDVSWQVVPLTNNTGHLLATFYALSGNLHLWAQREATLGSP